MKLLSIIVMLIFTVNTVAVAPYGLNGQSQSTTYPNVHQVPNKQVTNLGGINSLIETGNNNLLENPSFEHSVPQTGWTNSLGTVAGESSVVVHGKKSLKITLSSQAFDIYQNSTLYQAQFADGVQGLASIKIKTSISGLRVCAQKAGAVNSNLCVSINGDGKWGTYKVPFILGGTSNGIEIDSNAAAVTGDVYLDEAFVGAYGLSTDIPNVKTQYSQLESTATFTGNITISGALTDTNGSGLYSYDSATGIYTALDDINVVMSVFCRTSTSTAGYCAVRTSDTANDDAQTFVQAANALISASKTFNIKKGGTFSAQKGIGATSIDRANVSVLASKEINTSIYSSKNADTDWADCQFSTFAWQGLGTVTSRLKCKRQGGDLKIAGDFTLGTVTASEARMPLPLFNGVQLTAKNNVALPGSVNYAGTFIRSTTSTTGYKMYSGLSVVSAQYLNIGAIDYINNTANPSTPLTGSGGFLNGSFVLVDLSIPIEGWENSNIIIGQFDGLESCVSTLDCTDTFSAKVSNAGVVSTENVDWINGNCSFAGSVSTCTFNSGIFTVAPNCVATSQANRFTRATTSVTTFDVYNYNDTGVADQQAYTVVCQKQGADYAGKTAKAVASDQNLRMPGLTKVAIYQASISATDVVTDENADWINGDCTNATAGQSTCTLNANIFTSAPKCWVSKNQTGGANAPTTCDFLATPTTSTVSNFCKDSAGTALNAAFNLFCMGVTP